MKKPLLFLLLTAVVAALACSLTLYFSRCCAMRDDAFASHDWLHRELALTSAQLAALDPVEKTFAERQRRLADALRDANRDLARAMTEDKNYTPRVAAAIEHVHHCMGELQKASVEHLFAMRAVLTPAQGDRLLQLAAQALEPSP